MPSDTTQQCPCGSHIDQTDCCNPIILGQRVAATARELMRSRYTAYVQQNEQYLLDSWHTDFRPASLNFNNDDALHWLGLKITDYSDGEQHMDTGTVTFVARYKSQGGKAVRLEECSRFEKIDGCWLYCEAL